ncbi:MAG: hypothetical protein LBD94_00530 [Rickettsiales bacterium]|jgi:hypothetical protein|nr:hypothetical protein [Rickettsiales bacterium]
MNNEIVASAITSFNNAALVEPNFVWTAVLMLPVFIAVWKIAPELLDFFFPGKKSRDYNFAFLAEAMLVVWLIFNHGNWQSIRDGTGFLPYLVSAVLFLLCRDVMARLCEMNPKMPVWWRKIDRRTRKWIKIGILLSTVAVVAASAIQEFNFISLQINAVMFGIAAGYFGRKSAAPVNYLMMVMTVLAVGIAMQPEYFRFGQLGRLSFAHLAALAFIVMLGAVIFVFRNFNPSGFIRDNHYRYVKWFMRLGTLLALILFVMTESVPVLLGFCASAAVTSWFAVKHSDRNTDVFVLSGNLWAMMMFVFGMMTFMPVISIIGILCWKNNNGKLFWQNLLNVMK